MADTNLTPGQIALQFKDALEATGIYKVESDGRVRMTSDRGGGYTPPWVWAGSLPIEQFDETGRLNPVGLALRTPASDPSSAWHSMYQSGGLIHGRSEWDSSSGEYSQPINWGNIMALAVGGGIAAGFVIPAAAAASAGSGAGAGAGAGAGTLASSTIAPTLGTLPAVAASGAVPAALGTGTAIGAGTATGGTLASLAGTAAPAASAAGPGAAAASGPLASGLTGATTTAAVPASLAATGGTTAAAGGSMAGGSIWGTLIDAGIQQAGNYAASRQQANASDRSTDAQARANEAALAFLREQYANRQQQLAPYIQAGQQSLQGLSRFMGLPGNPTPATPTRPAPTLVTAGGAPGNPALANLVGYDAMGRPIGDANPAPQEPSGGSTGGLPGLSNLNTLPGLGWTAGIPGSPLGRPAQAQGGGGQSSYVTMRAPDGSQRQVPADQVPKLEAQGVQRVS